MIVQFWHMKFTRVLANVRLCFIKRLEMSMNLTGARAFQNGWNVVEIHKCDPIVLWIEPPVTRIRYKYCVYMKYCICIIFLIGMECIHQLVTKFSHTMVSCTKTLSS